jgi:hypothetical protein
LQRDKLTQEGYCGCRPDLSPVATTGFNGEIFAIFEPESSELIESGFTDVQTQASFRSIDDLGVKIGDSLADKMNRKSVDNLSLFTSTVERLEARKGSPLGERFLEGFFPRPTLRFGLLQTPSKNRVKCYFEL